VGRPGQHPDRLAWQCGQNDANIVGYVVLQATSDRFRTDQFQRASFRRVSAHSDADEIP
jgi:hypothetical protein